uniref:Uncharacterized protein n=1 Tax=viral metagenome TaxID=1070528 RepID=A0A6M3MH35_9ZZZZ
MMAGYEFRRQTLSLTMVCRMLGGAGDRRAPGLPGWARKKIGRGTTVMDFRGE